MTALVRYGPWILVTVAGLLLVRRPARSTTAARTWPTVPALPRGLGSVPARLRTTLASRGSRRGTRIWKL